MTDSSSLKLGKMTFLTTYAAHIANGSSGKSKAAHKLFLRAGFSWQTIINYITNSSFSHRFYCSREAKKILATNGKAS
jgi:hypothetical protein